MEMLCPEVGHLTGVSNTVLGYFTRRRLIQLGEHYSGGDIVLSIGEKARPSAVRRSTSLHHAMSCAFGLTILVR
jgi:hypothetical protein